MFTCSKMLGCCSRVVSVAVSATLSLVCWLLAVSSAVILSQRVIQDRSEAVPIKFEARRSDVEAELMTRSNDCCSHMVSVAFNRLHKACSFALSAPLRLVCRQLAVSWAVLQAVFYWLVCGAVGLLNTVLQHISPYKRSCDNHQQISFVRKVFYGRFLQPLLPFLSQRVIPDPSEAVPIKFEARRSDVEAELLTRLNDYALESLQDMGSRMCRFWFRVSPLHDPETRLVVSVTKAPSKHIRTDPGLLRKLFEQLKPHPYLQPVLACGYLHSTPSVYVMQPELPSLKDCIYGVANYNTDWGRKYRTKSSGICSERIALFGSQILQAVLFLYEQGFPRIRHVHSGNVFVEAGTHCRLGGYENLFPMPGYKTRLSKLFDGTPERIDVLMFGHLLFEMAAGYELTTRKPMEDDFEAVASKSSELVDVLDFIFSCDELEQVIGHSFFQDVELKRAIPKIRLSKDVKSLLKVVSSSPTKKKSKKKKCHMQ